MAREVIIRIIGETEATPSASNPNSPKGKNNAVANNGKKSGDRSLSEIMWAYLGKRAIRAIKNEAVHYAGKYFSAADDYKKQEMVANASSTIDDVTSLGFAAFAGYKMFANTAIGGPWGAVIGVAVTAVTKTAGAIKSYEQEAQKITENAYGNYFYGVRAGLVAGGHGTEN